MEQFIFILLLLVSASCHQWTEIELINEELKGYTNAWKLIKKQLREELDRISNDSDDFLSKLEKRSMVESINQMLDNDKCKKHFISIPDMKVAFKLQLNSHKTDLWTWLTDIETKLNQAISEVSSYQNIADGKILACNLKLTNCTDRINSWLEESLASLRCRLVTSCTEHAVSKRSLHDFCRPSEFHCIRSNQCIDGDSVCNGYCNCSPCDDEPDGCSRHCFGGFHCKNLVCISKEKICNGVDDCGDGSDEVGCPIIQKCDSETGGFRCDDRTTCIGLGKVCDGNSDCPDGSDEGGLCGLTACDRSCSTADGVCLGTPKGSQCLSHCPPGTGETAAGCLPGPKLSATVVEMLEDFPRLMTRYQSLYKWLQRKTVGKMATSVSEVVECNGGVYESLDDIIVLASPDNFTATHRPHTTTHHPHTTTHHPQTTTHHPHTTTDVSSYHESYDEDEYDE